MAVAMLLVMGGLLAGTGTSRAADFFVTTPDDSGPGSLRQAMLDANTTAGADRIVFDIDIPTNTDQFPDQIATIFLASPLPPVTDPVVIDAVSQQPGYTGQPLIEVRGQMGFVSDVETPIWDGLVFEAGSNGSEVRGLSLTVFSTAVVLLSGENVVAQNWIGLGADEAPRPNVTGVRVDGASNTIGRDNVITYNTEDGVHITGNNNVVVGNHIGLDQSGTSGPGNGEAGVYMGIIAGGNRIGGTDPLDRNFISGNEAGIYADSTTAANTIVGNYIGTDVTGTVGEGNGLGIELDNSAATIQGNLISGNGDEGVFIDNSNGTIVRGNLIGTDASGAEALGNGGGGIFIRGGSDYTVGGTEAGAGNVISGNGFFGEGSFVPRNGIDAADVEGLVVQGNVIGASVTEGEPLPNADGIRLEFTSGVTIGGTGAGAANVIAGNDDDGIQDAGRGTLIQGNFIGLNRAGEPLGNGDSGVRIESVPRPERTAARSAQVGAGPTEVGGTGAGNIIAFNGNDGVTVDFPDGFAPQNDENTIRVNSIHDNTDLGIDLGDDGPTPNDPGDPDEGPSNLQNFPALTSASASGGTVTVAGTLDTQPGAYIVDFYGNSSDDPEGETHLGSVGVDVDSGPAPFTADVPLGPGQDLVTATATDVELLNTSEFSPAITVAFPVTITTRASDDVQVGGQVSDTATLTGDFTGGEIIFRLYGPGDATCAGVPVFTSSVPIVADQTVYPSGPFTTTTAGTYRWVAEYWVGGEVRLASTVCGDPEETVVVIPAAPTLSTQASPPVTVGGSVTDTATLTGAFNPTGTVTFSLYGPGNTTCTGTPVFTSTVPVTGSGTATSGAFTPTLPGTYRWVASYSGDVNNVAVTGSCGDPNESVTVSAAPTTTTSTTTTLPPTTTTRPPTTTTSTTTTRPPTTTTSTTTTRPPTTTTTTTTPPPTTTSTTTTTTRPPTTTTTTLPPTTLPPTTVPPTTTTPTSVPPTTTTTAPPVPPTGTTTTVPTAPVVTTPTSTVPPPTTSTTAPPPPPPPPSATLDVVNPDGARSGPPGVGLDISGGGYPDCERVYFFLEGVRIGTESPDASGFVDASGLSVPGDTDPGEHRVTSSCSSSGGPVRASSTFLVTDADIHRTAFATSLPGPDQVPLEIERILASAAVAGLVILLFAFPSKLFNATVEENYDEIRGWFGRPARVVEAASTASRTVSFLVLNVLAAIALGFLNPDFGLNLNSLVLVAAFTLSLIVMSAGWSLPAAIGIHRRTGEWGKLNFLPGTLLVSIVMVVICRRLHIQPGYFYGALAGLAFASALNQRSQGRLVAANWTWALLLSLAAWFFRMPVSEAAAQPDASVLWIGVEAFLVMTFLWGIETLAVAMLPMRFLDGPKVKAWNRVVWGLLLFAGVFATVHVLLTPTAGYVGQTTEEVTTDVLVVFLIFSAVSVGTWAYFRYRPQRWAAG